MHGRLTPKISARSEATAKEIRAPLTETDHSSIINGDPFLTVRVYPTRSGSTHVLFSWNSVGVSSFSFIRARLYFTTTPYNQIRVNDSWSVEDENPFSDSMSNVTIRDVSYVGDGNLGEMYWNESGYSIIFAVAYRSSNDPNGVFYYSRPNDHHGSFQQSFDNFITSSAPSLSFNNNILTIGSLVSGRRIIEFHRTDIPYGGNTGITDEATLNEMLYTSMLNMEWENPYYGYYLLADNYWDISYLHRWRPGNYTVGVEFRDSQNQSIISSAIDNALSEINSVMNEFGINFTRSGTNGDIDVIVDTEYNLYGITLGEDPYIYGGTWRNQDYYDNNGYITKSIVKLVSDYYEYVTFMPYETAAFEELLQSMGAGYDQVEYPFQTIHTEQNYYNKASTMYPRDANILRLVYSNEVNVDDSYYDVCRKLNIPKGVYAPSTSTSNVTMNVNVLDFLERGGTYQVRAFIVNSSGNVSGTSNWLTIEVPEVSVEPWSWNASNRSALTDFPATASMTSAARDAVMNKGYLTVFSWRVWNDLVAKTMETIIARGGTWTTRDQNTGKTYLSYESTRMSENDKNMTAARFNALRFNIGSRIRTEIPDRDTGDIIYGNYFITLAQKLNDLIAML